MCFVYKITCIPHDLDSAAGTIGMDATGVQSVPSFMDDFQLVKADEVQADHYI